MHKVSIVYGYSELKEYHKFENGRMVFYGYRIDYDRNNNEKSRTEPVAISSISWDDGTPFTEQDYKKLGLVE